MGEFPDQLIVCDHHVSDAIECPFSWDRVGLYGVQYIPHVFFDGVYNFLGAPSCVAAADTYRGIIQTRLAETNGMSPVEITGGYSLEGEIMHISATFELVDPVTLNSPRAFFVITEDGVVASGTYDHVTRWGTYQNITLAQQGDVVVVTADATIPTAWNPNALKVVAWLQEPSGMLEVYQAAFLPEGDPADVDVSPWFAEEVQILSVGPNPMPANVSGPAAASVRFSLSSQAASGSVRLEVVDLSGRLVRQVYEGRLSSGNNLLTWDGRGQNGQALESGAYFIRLMTADGTSTARLVVVK